MVENSTEKKCIAEMNVITYETEADPALEFRFNNSYTKFKDSRKIIVQRSRIYEFIYKMDRGRTFSDPARNKEVQFQKRGNDIILNIIVNGVSYKYTLYPEERKQLEEWIDQNL